MFAGIRDGLSALATSRGGKLTSEKQIKLDKYNGLEVRLDFPQASLLQRFYVASNRLYQVNLVSKTEQRSDEPVALKVLDTLESFPKQKLLRL